MAIGRKTVLLVSREQCEPATRSFSLGPDLEYQYGFAIYDCTLPPRSEPRARITVEEFGKTPVIVIQIDERGERDYDLRKILLCAAVVQVYSAEGAVCLNKIHVACRKTDTEISTFLQGLKSIPLHRDRIPRDFLNVANTKRHVDLKANHFWFQISEETLKGMASRMIRTLFNPSQKSTLSIAPQPSQVIVTMDLPILSDNNYGLLVRLVNGELT